MKTFKQFCEEYRDPPLDRMDRKVRQLHGKFTAELENPDVPGALSRAAKLVHRVGNISAAAGLKGV